VHLQKPKVKSRETILKEYVYGIGNSEELYDVVRGLSNYVVERYFSYATFDRDEFVSMGIEAALIMLNAPHLDVTRNVQTVVFTKIRNTIRNHIVKRRVLATEYLPNMLTTSGGIEIEDTINIPNDLIQRFRNIGIRKSKTRLVKLYDDDGAVRNNRFIMYTVALKELNNQLKLNSNVIL